MRWFFAIWKGDSWKVHLSICPVGWMVWWMVSDILGVHRWSKLGLFVKAEGLGFFGSTGTLGTGGASLCGIWVRAAWLVNELGWGLEMFWEYFARLLILLKRWRKGKDPFWGTQKFSSLQASASSKLGIFGRNNSFSPELRPDQTSDAIDQ